MRAPGTFPSPEQHGDPTPPLHQKTGAFLSGETDPTRLWTEDPRRGRGQGGTILNTDEAAARLLISDTSRRPRLYSAPRMLAAGFIHPLPHGQEALGVLPGDPGQPKRKDLQTSTLEGC